MSSATPSVYRAEYVARINRCVDYINAHLHTALSLSQLASVAHFSPFYFHRLFKAITGETLNQYIVRARLARAAFLLRHNPNQPISSIAYDCGFSSPATFARSFRAAHDCTAAQWRTLSSHRSAPEHDVPAPLQQNRHSERIALLSTGPTPRWRIDTAEQQAIVVTIEQLPERNVVYLRHVGRYHQDVALFQQLFRRLLSWAGARGLLQFPQTQALTVFGGHPDSSDTDKLRVDVCLSVPVGTALSADIGQRKISGGHYAVVAMEAAMADCYRAWDIVFNEWLPKSGWQPDDRDYYLNHRNDPEQHAKGWHIVDLCIPVKPL